MLPSRRNVANNYFSQYDAKRFGSRNEEASRRGSEAAHHRGCEDVQMHLQMSSTTMLARLICCAKLLSVDAIDEAGWADRRDDMGQLVLPFVGERLRVQLPPLRAQCSPVGARDVPDRCRTGLRVA